MASRRTGSKTAAPVNTDSGRRTAVAERSRGFAVMLSRLPQYLVPAVIVALMITGLAAPLAIAIPALVIIFAFIGWLAYLSWPVLPTNQRSVRLLMLALILLAVIGRSAGWF